MNGKCDEGGKFHKDYFLLGEDRRMLRIAVVSMRIHGGFLCINNKYTLNVIIANYGFVLPIHLETSVFHNF